MSYPGGKASCYHRLINQIPPHEIYIEPFFGGGAIMKTKRPAKLNIGIDLDQYALLEHGHGVTMDPIFISDDTAANMWANVSAGIARNGGAITHLFITGDGLQFLSDYQVRHQTFIYCDPPYPKGTRRQQRDLYNFEMTDEQHERLLSTLLTIPAAVMISSYWSELYADMLSGWRLMRFQVQTRGGKPGDECIWMNYPEPVELHDYRYLGDNFRQREVITRRKRRWVNRLKKMNVMERQAMLAAIEEVFPPATSLDAAVVTSISLDVAIEA